MRRKQVYSSVCVCVYGRVGELGKVAIQGFEWLRDVSPLHWHSQGQLAIPKGLAAVAMTEFQTQGHHWGRVLEHLYSSFLVLCFNMNSTV